MGMHWGGMGPREKPERPADKAVRRENLRRIARLFRPYWKKLSVVTFLIFLASGLGVVPAFLTRDVFAEFVDSSGSSNFDYRRVAYLVFGMIAISIATSAI